MCTFLSQQVKRAVNLSVVGHQRGTTSMGSNDYNTALFTVSSSANPLLVILKFYKINVQLKHFDNEDI